LRGEPRIREIAKARLESAGMRGRYLGLGVPIRCTSQRQPVTRDAAASCNGNPRSGDSHLNIIRMGREAYDLEGVGLEDSNAILQHRIPIRCEQTSIHRT
jgi:hypothetical protein